MNSTDNFKKVIAEHLESLAANSELIAQSLKKKNKNIDDCVKYILNTVKQSGVNGFTDEEVFGMALHYYDEDDIEVGEHVSARIVTNHKVELTESDIQAAKQAAIDKVIAQEQEKIKAQKAKKVEEKKALTIEQPSLFD